MPYITTKVTTPLPQTKIDALTKAYGKLIEIFPGKTERWLMLDFTGDAKWRSAAPRSPAP